MNWISQSLTVVLPSLLLPAQMSLAQPAPAPEPPEPVKISAVGVGLPELPEIYYQTFVPGPDGKPITEFKPLDIMAGFKSTPVEVPFMTPLRLFEKVASENGTEKMVELVPIPGAKPGSQWILFVYQLINGDTVYRVVDDSPEKHGAQTIRVFNLSELTVRFNAGSTDLELPAGGETVVKPKLEPDGSFPFTLNAFRNGVITHREPLKFLRFASDKTRLLVCFGAAPVYEDTGNIKPSGLSEYTKTYQPLAFRIYDEIN